MAVTIKPALEALQSHLVASARFRGNVEIGEPKDPPADWTAAILLQSYVMPATTLAKTIERRDVIIRIYRNALSEPRSHIEFEMDNAVSEVIEDLLGDFDVGGNVRNIDVTAMTVSFGYQSIGRTLYRIGDILVPMIIDDSATFVA